jgi:glutamyl-tRNA synthetase
MVSWGPDVRVRFAPSPTGYFHVGGARSVLFNWAVARRTGGTLVLRIEDTDQARNRPEWTDGIISALEWLGIDKTQYEGPFFQSANHAKHTAAGQQLYADGRAYYCDCTRDDVVARRGNQYSGYDGYCRDRGLEPGPGRALRFRTPDTGATVIEDLVRGRTVFENSTIEDFVLARSDGSILFLLGNVVDDMDQRITHVLRSEEHLSNAPKQQLLFEALGNEPPAWGHLPIVVNEKRQKLSKRRPTDRVELEGYRDEGYLPEAMRNYLMLLGWGPKGDQEIMPFDEMVEQFRIEDVNPAPAFFDMKKLRAFNGDYIRMMTVEEFIDACQPWLTPDRAPWPADRYDPDVFARLAILAQTRVALLADITSMVDFGFLPEPPIDEAAWTKAMKEPAADLLRAVAVSYEALAEWETDVVRDRLEEIGQSFGLNLSKAQAPVRVAVTGRTVGLPLFESLHVLGKDETLRRIRSAQARLDAESATS